jgi:hypothetical protein
VIEGCFPQSHPEAARAAAECFQPVTLTAAQRCTVPLEGRKGVTLMALTYQVAHMSGLVLITGLGQPLYGDIEGEP